MHISEGILTAPVLAGGAALTIAGTAIGLEKLDYDRIMTVSLLSATFFVASLIHVPIGPGSVHLLLGGRSPCLLSPFCLRYSLKSSRLTINNNNMSIRILLLAACLLFLPFQVEAHKIHVFAWVSGNTVTVESNFSENKPLLHGKITVKDNTSGAILLQGTGNTKGIFTFTVPPEARARKTDLLILVTGSEGHQSEWLVPATEYLLEDSTQAPVQHAGSISNAELQILIKEIVAQELAPIKRSLAENRQEKPDLRDIMAGIGFLLGLAGLVTWMRNRKAKGTATDD